jgi:hypothetical protein
MSMKHHLSQWKEGWKIKHTVESLFYIPKKIFKYFFLSACFMLVSFGKGLSAISH